jgi:lipoprotein NlpD
VTSRAAVALVLVLGCAPTVALGATTARAKAKAAPKPAVTTAAMPEPTDDKRSTVAGAAAVHDVARGDTLTSIAKKYRVSVASLVIANRLRGPRAKPSPGQQLRIPRPGAGPTFRGRRAAVDEPLPASLVLGVPEFDEPPPFLWPVTGPVTSTFGRRKRGWHRGLDIHGDAGAPIVAAAPGVVVASGFEPRYGQRVTIEHEGGFATVYAHNQRNLVEVGETVTAGQVIAFVGRTGRATGEHVHFEIRYEGRVYNPLYLLPLPPRPVTVDLTIADEADDDE